jgi:hypothetical protein
VNPLLEPDLVAVRRLALGLEEGAYRLVWRAASQRRAIRIASILRRLPRAVRVRHLRERSRDGWIVLVVGEERHAVLTVATRRPTRTLADLGEPVAVTVHDAACVDLDVLDAMQARGLVRVMEDAR